MTIDEIGRMWKLMENCVKAFVPGTSQMLQLQKDYRLFASSKIQN